MQREDVERVWPERLKIRDTGLHDDLGGPGQRIYTTAGRGYERVEYVRADLIAALMAERDAAFAAGQESMRERAALEALREKLVRDKSDSAAGATVVEDYYDNMDDAAAAIRALPIKPRP